MTAFELHQGDCLDVLRAMPEASVDAVVTDPPYGLRFMGRKWDCDVPSVQVWVECLRVLKPGAHLLAFAGTRTQHRMASRIDDAGFEIRDMIAWVYASGMPKSHNGTWGGTALKPALEPITLARKGLAGTVESNWRKHGTGALNIDACRVAVEGEDNPSISRRKGSTGHLENRLSSKEAEAVGRMQSRISPGIYRRQRPGEALGRWPANLIHDGSADAIQAFRDKSMARLFYCPKASNDDRNDGLERRNIHPTVKPTDLMRYLCRLVTPPGGVVLDPFMGSGSTGKAAMLEGLRFIGIELSAEYVAIARDRIAHAASLGRQPSLLEVACSPT